MGRIAIAGAGISGLTLALRLQQQGVDTALWTDRTPEQVRSGRLLNLVARFAPTLARAGELGVNHWGFADFATHSAHVAVVGTPIAFRGDLDDRPGSWTSASTWPGCRRTTPSAAAGWSSTRRQSPPPWAWPATTTSS